eukprot:1140322-Pelagomonas_calceolata.AAC.3
MVWAMRLTERLSRGYWCICYEGRNQKSCKGNARPASCASFSVLSLLGPCCLRFKQGTRSMDWYEAAWRKSCSLFFVSYSASSTFLSFLLTSAASLDVQWHSKDKEEGRKLELLLRAERFIFHCRSLMIALRGKKAPFYNLTSHVFVRKW